MKLTVFVCCYHYCRLSLPIKIYLIWTELKQFVFIHSIFGPVVRNPILGFLENPWSRLEMRPNWTAFVYEWWCRPDSSESKDRFPPFWSSSTSSCHAQLWYLIYKTFCTIDMMFTYYFWQQIVSLGLNCYLKIIRRIPRFYVLHNSTYIAFSFFDSFISI